MKKTRLSEKKGVFSAKVRDNIAVKGRFYRLSLQLAGEGALAFSQVIPGQFVEVSLCETALPPVENIPGDLLDRAQRQIILRRPFSFCDVEVTSQADVRIEILYCVLGPATLRMTTLAEGDRISIIGPLGNGFSVPDGKKRALLVAGGMGAPPLQHLAGYLKANFPKMRVVVFAGAKSVADLPFSVQSSDKNGIEATEFAGFGVESHIATDDGSAGFRGFVTDCVRQWLKKHAPDAGETIIYGCGPERMLAEVAKLADEHNIHCQVSMERMMACGIGVCQSCAVETRATSQTETVYKLCCKDGPVFDAKEVVFEQR
jgi:dihydroorotate dehydrogenase electron transfer subunit